MGITYVGDVTFRQSSPPAWKAKATYDPDECSVSYTGGALLKEAFLSSFQRGIALAYQLHDGTTISCPKMFLDSVSDDGHRHRPTVTLNYRGFRDGNPPPVKADPSLYATSTTTTAPITDPASPVYGDGTTKLTLNYQYFAARVGYSWWTTEEPDENDPEFDTPINTTDPLDSSRFIGRSITGGNISGLNQTSIGLAEFIALFNTLSRAVQISDYKPVPVIPGKLWQCSVTVDYVLVGT